ncbi:glycosyltransferase family 4 protein [Peijinzhouia sedimentorum]
MKRITIIHQYFKTPEDGGGIRSWYLAKGLVEREFEVTVISSWNKPEYQELFIDGIKVIYLPVPYHNQFKFWRRVKSFGIFARKAYSTAKSLSPKTDLFYLITTPLSVPALGLLLKKPFLVEVGDLWPDAPIELGYIRNPVLKSLLYNLERRIYTNSAGIIALSSSIEEAIHKKLGAIKKPLTTITNFADVEYFNCKREVKKDEVDIFQIGYIGAMGRANGLEMLLDVAAIAMEKADKIRFVLMGEGSERVELMEKTKSLNLNNVEFIDHSSKWRAKELLEASDAAFVSYAPYSILTTGSPNKLFDGLAAAKLIILNFNGWMKDLVEANDCGFAYNSEHPEEFFEKIEPFLNSSNRLEEVQRNARRLAVEKFDRRLQIEASIQFIQNLPGR